MPKRGPEREEERMEETWYLRENGGGISRTAETRDSRLKDMILEGIWLIMTKHCKARAGQIKMNSLVDTQAELQNPKDQEKTLRTTRKTRQVIYNFSTDTRLEDKDYPHLQTEERQESAQNSTHRKTSIQESTQTFPDKA